MIRVILPARLLKVADEMAKEAGPNLEVLRQAVERKETLVLPVVSVFFAAHQLRTRHAGAELERRTERLRVLVDLTEDEDCPIILATCDELPTTVEAWFGEAGIELPWERMAADVVQRMKHVHPGRKVISW